LKKLELRSTKMKRTFSQFSNAGRQETVLGSLNTNTLARSGTREPFEGSCVLSIQKPKRRAKRPPCRLLDNLPRDVFYHIVQFLDFPCARVFSNCSKEIVKLMESPKAYRSLAIEVEALDFDPTIWVKYGERGLFNGLKTVRIYKENETNSKRQAGNLITLVATLNAHVRSLQILTIELGGLIMIDFPCLGNLLRMFMEKNANTLEMLLLHTDSSTCCFPVPQANFPVMYHLNFAGDVPKRDAKGNPPDSLLQRVPQLKWLKVTGLNADIERYLDYATEAGLRPSELTIRPICGIHKQPYSFVDLHILQDRFQEANIEWNSAYDENEITERQLLEIVSLRNKQFMKLSSKHFTDAVLEVVGDNSHIKGLFLGRHAFSSKDVLLRTVEKMPQLQWLRLSQDYGPHLTEPELHHIRTNHPGIKLWQRPFRDDEPEKEGDHVQVWEIHENP